MPNHTIDDIQSLKRHSIPPKQSFPGFVLFVFVSFHSSLFVASSTVLCIPVSSPYSLRVVVYHPLGTEAVVSVYLPWATQCRSDPGLVSWVVEVEALLGSAVSSGVVVGARRCL